MTKRKKLFVLSGITVIAGMVLLIPNRKRPLASLTYLGGTPHLDSQFGRFSISNTTDRPIIFNVIGVEYYSNQVWELETSSRFDKTLAPHKTDLIEFAPPAGAKRWRGWINVGQEQTGIASIRSRVSWFWGQARVGFRSGLKWPTGKIVDGDVIITVDIDIGE